MKDDFYFELWVEPTLANAGRVVAALTEFGYSAYSDHVQEFATLDRMTHVGNPPFRIDAMTTISGVPSFRAAWRRRVAASVGGLDVAFLGRADFGERQAIQGQLEI